MNVYTLYRKIPNLWEEETQRNLISLWRDSWKTHGWNPIIFEEGDIEKIPNLQDVKNKIWRLPTLFGANFELACTVRWLLAGNAGGGMLADYDVFNYGFRPPEALPEKLTVLCADPPACVDLGAVLGTKEHFQRMFDLFMALEFDPARDTYNGEGHCGDAVWFMRMFEFKNLFKPDWITRAPGCVRFGAPGWRNSFLVHYGFEMHQVGLWPKYKHIPNLR